MTNSVFNITSSIKFIFKHNTKKKNHAGMKKRGTKQLPEMKNHEMNYFETTENYEVETKMNRSDFCSLITYFSRITKDLKCSNS